MQNYIVPDSPNWIFVNSSNVVATTSSYLIYSAHKKIILISTSTGKAENVIFPGKEILITHIASTSNFLSCYTTDGYIRTYSLHNLQEISKFIVDGCIGLKYWANDIVCISKHVCKVYRNIEIIQEFPIDEFFSISTDEEYLGISQKSSVVVYRFLESFSIPGSWLVINIKKFDDVYVLLINTNAVMAYKKDMILCDIPLKRAACKLKQPVFAICWISVSRFVYTTLAGEIIIVNILPLVTQSFMNNPHTKAILALQVINYGVVSIGMDRNICLWDITPVENTSNCPRTYSSAIVYTEPIWEYQTLEGSIYSLSLTQEKIFISSGKPCLLVFDLDGINMHGRSIWKNIPGNITYIEPSFNAEVLAIICGNEIVVMHIQEEKILGKIIKSCIKIAWKDEHNIYGCNSHEIFMWNYITNEITVLLLTDLDIKVFICIEDDIYIGTGEGNIIRYCKGIRKNINIIHNRAITCLSSGPFLIAGSEDGTISVHKPIVLLLEKHYRPVLCVCWIEKIIVSSSMDHTVQLWDSENGIPLGNFRLHQGAVRFCIPHPKEKGKIFTGSDDQTVRFWSISDKLSAIAPPKISNYKKFECTKTLFPNFHIFIYQQNKENSLLSILSLLNNENNIESMIFRMTYSQAIEIIETQKLFELNLWIKIKDLKKGQKKQAFSEDIDEEWEELSFLLDDQHLETYAKKKAEEALLKRKIHKSVIWYLVAGDIQKAISLYIDQKLFIEALVLSGLFEYPITEIYKLWAIKLISSNKPEQAVKCYLGINDYETALSIIQKIPNCEKLQAIIIHLEEKLKNPS